MNHLPCALSCLASFTSFFFHHVFKFTFLKLHFWNENFFEVLHLKNYKMEHKTIFLLNTTETEGKEITSMYQKWVFRTRLMKRKKNTLSLHNIHNSFPIWALSNHHKNTLRGGIIWQIHLCFKWRLSLICRYLSREIHSCYFFINLSS